MQDSTVRKVVITSWLVLISLVLIFSNFGNSKPIVVYDCGMAEWHPDIPKEVRDECRKLRLEEFHQRNEQENPRKNLTTT